MCLNLPFFFSIFIIKFHFPFWCPSQNTWTYWNNWRYLFFLVTDKIYLLYLTSINVQISNTLTGYNKLTLKLSIIFTENYLTVIIIGEFKLVHLHYIESAVWKNKFISSTKYFSNPFRYLNNLNAFHEV